MNHINSFKKIDLHHHIQFIAPIQSGSLALGYGIYFIGEDVWMLSISSFVGLLLGGILGSILYKIYQQTKQTPSEILVNHYGFIAGVKEFCLIVVPMLFCTLIPNLVISLLYLPWMGLSTNVLLLSLLTALGYSLVISLIVSIYPFGTQAR